MDGKYTKNALCMRKKREIDSVGVGWKESHTESRRERERKRRRIRSHRHATHISAISIANNSSEIVTINANVMSFRLKHETLSIVSSTDLHSNQESWFKTQMHGQTKEKKHIKQLHFLTTIQNSRFGFPLFSTFELMRRMHWCAKLRATG